MKWNIQERHYDAVVDIIWFLKCKKKRKCIIDAFTEINFIFEKEIICVFHNFFYICDLIE